MERKKRYRTLLATSCLALAMWGAGSAWADDKELITLTTTLEGSGQDILTSSVHGQLAYWDEVFDWVIEQDPTGAFVPALATKWYPSDDKLTWTFEIRDGVKFHDGSTLTAEDVAWTWNRLIFDPASTAAVTDFRDVISSIKSDGNKVIVGTKIPQSELPLVFARSSGSQGAIQSRAHFEAVGAEQASLEPIGTGPYRFVSLNGTQSVELAAFTDPNRNEWQKARTPAFHKLTIIAVPEASTRTAMLRSGDADVAQIPISALEEAKGAGLQIMTSPSGSFSNMLCVGVSLNPESPCNDIKVREALNIAINRQAIADAVYFSYAKPLNAFFAGPNTFGNPSDLKAAPYDPERAKALLAEAGYNESNPLKVEIDAYADDADFPDMPTLAQAILGDYKKIGIDGSIAITEWGAHELKLEEETLPGQAKSDAVTPVTLWMRGSDNRSNMIAEQVQGYTASGPKGKAAWSEQNMPEMKDKLHAVQAEFDTAKREAMFADYNRWMAENFYQIPLLSSDVLFAVSDKVASWDGRVAGRSYVHNQWSMKPAN